MSNGVSHYTFNNKILFSSLWLLLHVEDHYVGQVSYMTSFLSRHVDRKNIDTVSLSSNNIRTKWSGQWGFIMGGQEGDWHLAAPLNRLGGGLFAAPKPQPDWLSGHCPPLTGILMWLDVDSAKHPLPQLHWKMSASWTHHGHAMWQQPPTWSPRWTDIMEGQDYLFLFFGAAHRKYDLDQFLHLELSPTGPLIHWEM